MEEPEGPPGVENVSREEPTKFIPGLSGLDELGDGLYGIGLETVRDLILTPDIAISL